jgi:hypothetical protein
MRSVAFFIAGLVLTSAAHAADRAPRVTGFFSDMHYNEEGGDVIGTEVHIVVTRGGYHAVVQCAEGEPGVSVVVPVVASGSAIEFELPDQQQILCCPGRFRGTVSKDALRGKFDGCGDKLVLKRKRSYWQ